MINGERRLPFRCLVSCECVSVWHINQSGENQRPRSQSRGSSCGLLGSSRQLLRALGALGLRLRDSRYSGGIPCDPHGSDRATDLHRTNPQRPNWLWKDLSCRGAGICSTTTGTATSFSALCWPAPSTYRSRYCIHDAVITSSPLRRGSQDIATESELHCRNP